jgi:hypothetical protein
VDSVDSENKRGGIVLLAKLTVLGLDQYLISGKTLRSEWQYGDENDAY